MVWNGLIKRSLLQYARIIRLSPMTISAELCCRSKTETSIMYRKFFTLLLLLVTGIRVSAADSEPLSLDSCRRLAINGNKELRIAANEKITAYYNRKSAFTNYLPRVSATGIYMHTGKELSLLSDEQKSTLSGIGDALSYPQLNSLGQNLVDAFRTDTRNVGAVAIMLTQPLYTGGKIRAYNNIARHLESIAEDRYNIKYQDLIVDVDETYWNIVALSARKGVAESYLELVKTLDSDIEKMITEGLATKADGLSVKVKVNEAKVAVIQVDNGLDIMKMKLCQLCGLPLETSVVLEDEAHDSGPNIDVESFMQDEPLTTLRRPELSALATSVRVYEEKEKLERAEYLPSVALTGGYMASDPSVFNSFEKKFKGTWNIGLAVKIPILTCGDRYYKQKSAQVETTLAKLKYEELCEMVELQISQSRQKVMEAKEKYAASLSSQQEADENLRYATLGMKEGVIPVSNVLEAQTAWLSAKTCLISSGIDLRLACVYLKKALGTIR